MTAEETRSEDEAERGASPFVAPAYAIREVPFDAPYGHLAWVEIALLLFMLFLGPQPMPPLGAFVSNLLLTPRELGLLIVGTGVGMALAATVFAISAVAVPLLMVERVDVVTAALTSIRACRKNPKAIALWAALIAGAMLFGFVTLFFGLLMMFPAVLIRSFPTGG